jgi:hypothetical protein
MWCKMVHRGLCGFEDAVVHSGIPVRLGRGATCSTSAGRLAHVSSLPGSACDWVTSQPGLTDAACWRDLRRTLSGLNASTVEQRPDGGAVLPSGVRDRSEKTVLSCSEILRRLV